MVDSKAHTVESQRTIKLSTSYSLPLVRLLHLQAPYSPSWATGEEKIASLTRTWLTSTYDCQLPIKNLNMIFDGLSRRLHPLSDELEEASERCLDAKKVTLEQAAEETLQVFLFLLFSLNYCTDPTCCRHS